jgi:hypothetical protein
MGSFIVYRRRRVGSFQNFRYLSGDGCAFSKKSAAAAVAQPIGLQL